MLVPQLQFDVILGVDFFRETKAKIDLDSQMVTLYNGSVGTDFLNDTNTILRTTEAVFIPPKSEALIPVIVPHHFRSGLAIIEPSVKLHKLQLALERSMVSPVNNRSVCKVIQQTLPDFLKERHRWGSFRNFSWTASR